MSRTNLQVDEVLQKRIQIKTSSPKRLAMLFVEIVMCALAFIFLFPALLTLVNSFKSHPEIVMNPFALPTKLQLSNYANAWRETNFPVVLANTFLITLGSTIGIVLVSSMAAYVLVRFKWKISWVIFLLFTFSMVVPFQAIMVPLFANAKSLNLLTILGIIPIYIGLGCPLAIFMYHGFIKGVPLEIEESAAIDGASMFRRFFQVVFPLLTPITATVAILNVLWIWNDFLLPLLIIPGQTLQLAQYKFIGQFRQDYALAMASLVLSASPIVLFYLIMQKHIIKGISAGAVKG